MRPLGKRGRLEVAIEWRGAKAAERALTRLWKRAPKATSAAMMVEAEKIMKVSKERAPRWLGTMEGQSFVRRTGSNQYGPKITMGYNSPYALAHHEGWEIGKMPNVDNIKPWALANLGSAHAAYGVALSIQKQGFKIDHKKFLENPMNEALVNMARRIVDRVKRET